MADLCTNLPQLSITSPDPGTTFVSAPIAQVWGLCIFLVLPKLSQSETLSTPSAG